jgi:hypothetical protein
MEKTQLYNVSLARGKFSKEIVMRNVPYGIAAMKRKQLWASGVIKRNVWIEKIELPKTQLSK